MVQVPRRPQFSGNGWSQYGWNDEAAPASTPRRRTHVNRRTDCVVDGLADGRVTLVAEVLGGDVDDGPNFLDLIPPPVSIFEQGFDSFQTEIDNGTGFWGIFIKENGDCLDLILHGDNRSVWHASPHEFWRFYDGDTLSDDQLVDMLPELYSKMLRCGPPPIRRPFDCISAGKGRRPPSLNMQFGHGVSGCSSEELHQLVADAWIFLQENFDVIEWIACILYDGLDECMRDYLFQEGDPRVVVIHGGASALGQSTELGGRDCSILLNLSSICKIWNTQELITDECVVMDFAAVLLHEIVHCCASETKFHDRTTLTDNPETCGNSYLMGNFFRWAMANRFSDEMNGTPCADYSNACMVLNDANFGRGTSCA